MRFSHLSPQGEEICSVVVEHFWSGVYGLQRRVGNVSRDSIKASVWNGLFRQAVDHAKSVNAKTLMFRLIEAEDSRKISELLPSLGFRKKHDRVEYQAQIDTLPGDQGSPLVWRSVSSMSDWSIERVGEFLKTVTIGDADFDPSEDVIEYMQDWLKDPVLTSGLECIAIGFLENKPAAFVVAQINPKSGWSRISYMGIVPEFRNRGLGKWVHRHGFCMMRSQGGTLYHGGTVATNAAMIRLFLGHGCREFRRMEEWVCRF